MTRYTLIFFLAIFSSFSVRSQDSVYAGFGHVLPAEFHPISPVIDSNADVVVLTDIGEARLEGGYYGWKVKFTRYRKLLIKDRKGLDAAKVSLSFDPYENGSGRLGSLHANTYNLENGEVVKTPVDTADLYMETEKDGDQSESFSFPDVKEGSIIEYTYSMYGGSLYKFHSWDFQGDYPRLNSEYTVAMPAIFNYAVTKPGAIPIARTTDSSIDKIQIGNYTIKSLVFHIHWKAKDVPALEDEPYVSTMDDHRAGIRFQLSEYTNIDTKKRIKYLNNWKDLNDKFYKNKTFGGIMTASTHFLRRELREIVADSLPDMAKAKKLFEFVRDNFTTGGSELMSDDDRTIKEIFKSKKGSVSEVNLLLTAMLRDEGLKADAVILSTRGNGVISPTYPLTGNLNYVIVRLRLDGREYFLDATDRQMGFGKIPLECYNGYARVVSEQPDSVMLEPDSLTEFKFGSVFLSPNDSGDGMTGTVKETQGYYTSLAIRNTVSKKDDDAYFEEVRKDYPFEVQLSDKHIDSLHDYDEPVTIRYTVNFALGGDDRLYFNPMLFAGMKENPFSAAVRHNPIEMPFKMDELYVIQMYVPKGYEVEEMPKSVRVNFNGTQGSFEYMSVVDGESIQLRCRMVLGETFFLPEDYKGLRDFFSVVVKKEAELIVFRRKK